ncbi:alkaline phosphatase [Demequina mangrovi]|uniref:Alkaline phosphatase n=1 Tax=Demequina mangrovi TaxID=1043493 RepID=A0A1H6WKL7_9MICO|nr:alkaline phosphatase [Demequina mangrovi]SEJ13022.1 alkaline phosphatase [Demequina mangrovi]
MRTAAVIAVTALTTGAGVATAGTVLASSQTSNPWYQGADASYAAVASTKASNAKPKNVILFVGDGMGISTVTAARILEGQLEGATGEENALSFEEFPNVALSKVYNVDSQVPDSAGTMTAMMTGVKTDIGVLGVDEGVVRGDCDSVAGTELTSWMMLAESAGKATGVVSTARLTHATPGGTYAISADRDWEDDGDLPEGCEDYEYGDIASQLLSFERYGDGFEVALGGGRRHFLTQDEGGNREDGRDLTAEWADRGDGWAYVDTASALDGVDLGATDHLLGLFASSHMSYEHDRVEEGADEPSLTEMTEVALEQLQDDKDGFALMVESGRIDHAHHEGNAYRALTETIELSNAVAKAVEMVDLSETMIVVTADHSHVFTIAGYPERGNDILGVGGEDSDGVPYTTLTYANGGEVAYGIVDGEVVRLDPSESDTSDPDYHQQVLVNTGQGAETHSGEDVAIYSVGAKAQLFNGVQEQNYIGVSIIESLGLDSVKTNVRSKSKSWSGSRGRH